MKKKYSGLQSKQQQVEIAEQIQTSSLEIVSEPLVPTQSIGPNKF